MMKNKSSINQQIRVYDMEQIMNDQIPKRIQKAKDLLCIENQDTIISILRHFNYNQTKIEENWFESQDKLEVEIGLKFDQLLTSKYPEISKSLAS